MIDEILLDDIGLAFYVRCKQAKEIREVMDEGIIICHHCGATLDAKEVSPTGAVQVKIFDKNALMKCVCGYSYTYREYRRSYNTANIPGNRATPIFNKFLEKWIVCRDAKQKMIVIDWLIHEFHVTLMSDSKGRSVCINLIEGSLKQISELIIKIAYEDSN